MAIGKAAGRLALAAILTMAIAAPVSAGGAVATTIEITVVGEVETFTTTGGLFLPGRDGDDVLPPPRRRSGDGDLVPRGEAP